MTACPLYGPRDGHIYTDEDTGQYVGRCPCGATDPAATPRPTAKSLEPGDDPPF